MQTAQFLETLPLERVERDAAELRWDTVMLAARSRDGNVGLSIGRSVSRYLLY